MKEWVSKFKLSQASDKGKAPMDLKPSKNTQWICPIYANNKPSKCHPWSFCCNCSSKGHISAHCTAHWHITGRKVQFQWTAFGNMNNSNEEASYSKNPFNLSMNDNLTATAPSPSSSDTLLHIGLYQSNSRGFHSLEISH
jgi:hypothetical protein